MRFNYYWSNKAFTKRKIIKQCIVQHGNWFEDKFTGITIKNKNYIDVFVVQLKNNGDVEFLKTYSGWPTLNILKEDVVCTVKTHISKINTEYFEVDND